MEPLKSIPAGLDLTLRRLYFGQLFGQITTLGKLSELYPPFHSLIPQRVLGLLSLIRFYSINSIILYWISTPGFSRPIPRVTGDTVRALLCRGSALSILVFFAFGLYSLVWLYEYALALTTSPPDFILSTRHGTWTRKKCQNLWTRVRWSLSKDLFTITIDMFLGGLYPCERI